MTGQGSLWGETARRGTARVIVPFISQRCGVMLTLDDDEWLLADVGGTYARFMHWGTASSDAFQKLRNEHYGSLAEAVAAFETAAGAHASQAALALATPILGDRLRLTNRDWQFSATALRAACGWRRLLIVNDFVAAAAGLPAMQTGDRQLLQSGSAGVAQAHGTGAGMPADAAGTVRMAGTRPWLLLGPGTGLGCAVLLDVGDAAERVLASEAGHMSFAPPDPRIDSELQRAACQRWGRVSWERLLSGSGLAWLHGQLANGPGSDAGAGTAHSDAAHGDTAHHDAAHGSTAHTGTAHAATTHAASAIDAAEVVRRALAGEDIARAAVTRFCGWLGACAGDLCLAFGADGGVHLTGGVINGLGAAFDTEAFLRAFRDKGRAAARLAHVPVLRLGCDDLAFRGLQRIVAGHVRAPGLSIDEGGLIGLA